MCISLSLSACQFETSCLRRGSRSSLAQAAVELQRLRSVRAPGFRGLPVLGALGLLCELALGRSPAPTGCRLTYVLYVFHVL